MADALPHIQSAEDILSLDLKKAFTLGKGWKLDLKGIKGLDQLQELLLEHWFTSRPPDQNGKNSLANASKEHEKTRKTLYDKYKKAEELFSELTSKIKSNLEQSHPNVQKTIQEKKESLKSGECTIVVAGEIGSGKSSLVNMVLETQLFPTDTLKCTNTICEIRYHDRKKEAIFYFKSVLTESEKGRNTSPKIIQLNSLSGIQEFKDCVSEIDQSDYNPYEKCEVYFPFPSLSKGVVIVDTPGIEGGENVDQRLQTYLSKAFGFVYVINTNTAGGVQHGRLGHLLRTVVNSCEDFSPDASLFIGNKWENVPEHDREDVRRDTFQKLSQIYPGLRSHQVLYMSVRKCGEFAMKFKKHNAKMDEHVALLKGVSELVPSALRQGMVSHYWWLSSFLSRASYLLRVTNVQHNMSRGETDKQLRDLKQHVENLKKNADESVKRLRDKVEFEIFRIINALQDLLKDKEFVNSLCNWEDGRECPNAENKWKNTADNAAIKISERLARMIDGWVRQKNILKNIDKEIIEVFSTELGLMDDQIQELEACLAGSKNNNMFKTVRVVPVRAIFAKKKKKIEKTYSTLGGAVSCIGMLNTDKKAVRKIFKDGYNDTTKSRKMAEACILYIETILENKDFSAKFRKFFDRFFKDIDEAAKRIPGFLQADQQLIETLGRSLEEGERISQKYPQLVNSCSELLSKLDIFYINEIKKFDFELSELEWENKRELGRGAFAVVYASSVKRKARPVALKVSSEIIGESNVTDTLTEDRTMRDLRHENIVRYFGASYMKSKKGLYWIMVIELCKTTLKHVYTESGRNERNIPGCLDKDHHRYLDAAKTMLDHSMQICWGLDHIHEKGYTHRDMKLENVLLADNNVVKITDVGVAKTTKQLTSTCNGSPAYMAPEVLLSSRNQTNKIDIYSMAVMFWEMWFGKDIANVMNEELLGPGFHGDAMSVLREFIAKPNGWKPSLSSARRPPDSVCDMLRKGLSFEPEARPTAKEFGLFLQNFARNNLH